MGDDAPGRATFTTTVLDPGGTKAGIEVPDHVLDALGGGRTAVTRDRRVDGVLASLRDGPPGTTKPR